MADPNDLLAANLVEALRQLQQYIVISLGASVSALALTLKTASRARVTVPGTAVAVDPDVASLILLAACLLAGAMASYAAESINLIAQRLDPAILASVCTFPSVATSPYMVVRALAALIPVILSMVAIYRFTRGHGTLGRKSMLGWLIFFVLAYGPLLRGLLKSNCLAK